jgi:DNA uptake protein ComE-like DNA-binding protein
MLQDSLGGNSKSTIIANVAPGNRAFGNTQRTLEFAALSRAIINTPSINVAAVPAPVAAATAPQPRPITSSTAAASATSSSINDAALGRAIVERMKEAGLDTLASEVKKLVEMERKRQKEPPKTPNTRTKEYQSHIVRSKAFEKDGLMLDALDELTTCYKKMQQDDLIIKALPSSVNAQMLKAVKTKIDKMTAQVNEATKKTAAAPAPTAAKAAPVGKGNLLSSFNSANKENLSQSAANAAQPSKRGQRAPAKKRKRSDEEDEDDSYDDAKHADEAVLSESEEEPAKPVKPAPKRAKKVATEEDELAEREAAKQRVRNSLSTFGHEIHVMIANLVNTFNEGSQKEITKLHGIGKKRAELIITHRTNSSIRAIEQLLDVQGISEKILDNIIRTNVIAGVFFDKQKEEAKHFEALQTQQRAEYMMDMDPIMDD